jgi:hypothetical protein
MTYVIAEPCIDITQALELGLLELAECMVVSSRGRTEHPDSTGSR